MVLQFIVTCERVEFLRSHRRTAPTSAMTGQPSAISRWQRAEGSTVPGLGPWRPESESSFDRQVFLTVIGDMGCGKTSLSIRFCSGVFVPVQSTVGVDSFVRTVVARDGRRVQVRVWDTAGQERFRALVGVPLRGVHGSLIVYDCTRADTFRNAPAWAGELLAKTRVRVPTVLVGNKTDEYGLRQVVVEEGANLGRELGAVEFFETSAKDGSNVEAAFLALVDAILQTQDEPPSAGEGNPFVLCQKDDTVASAKRWCSC